MRILLATLSILLSGSISFGQNINDNKVNFGYIQLPIILIDEAFTKYEVRTEHSYLKANEDSLALYEVHKDAAKQEFDAAVSRYYSSRDSLERLYLVQLANWEKQVNSGAKDAQGQPPAKPNPPIFPEPPVLKRVDQPFLHTEMNDSDISGTVNIEGYEQGLGGFIVTLDVAPVHINRIVETKKGSGASTKYYYTCEYTLPVHVKLESPTQGVLIDQVMLEGAQSYKMNEQKSRYDHQLYMMDHTQDFYRELEQYARQHVLTSTVSYINEQVGFMNKTRHTEIYSVKRFKDYDYSDVTNAYTATVQALNLVGNDRDCSGAQEALNKALAMWNEVMMESNTYDNKARINDKVSAVIQCNIAEIQLWQAEFNRAQATLNLALNAGVLKAKGHAKSMLPFVENRKNRWEVNF